MQTMLNPFELDNVLRIESGAVLLAFLEQTPMFREQMEALAKFEETMNRPVTILVPDPVFLELVAPKYGVRGAPTFVLYDNKVRVGMLLGKAGVESLVDFVAARLRGEGCNRPRDGKTSSIDKDGLRLVVDYR